MTLIILVALQKKFSFMRCSFFWKPFVSNTQICLFYVYFHHTGCPKNEQCQKLKYMTSIIILQLLSHKNIYLFKVNFHHTGCPKKWTEFSHISQILANFIAFSILQDTLFGENSLGIRVYMYLRQEAPKRLQLIKENFFVNAAIMINVTYFNVQPISWHCPFLGHPEW